MVWRTKVQGKAGRAVSDHGVCLSRTTPPPSLGIITGKGGALGRSLASHGTARPGQLWAENTLSNVHQLIGLLPLQPQHVKPGKGITPRTKRRYWTVTPISRIQLRINGLRLGQTRLSRGGSLCSLHIPAASSEEVTMATTQRP